MSLSYLLGILRNVPVEADTFCKPTCQSKYDANYLNNKLKPSTRWKHNGSDAMDDGASLSLATMNDKFDVSW